MSVSVTITNLAAVATPVTEAYVVLGATGAVNDAVTIERSVAELDSMRGLKALVDAGTVDVDIVQASDNVDLLSIPIEQHGTTSAQDVGVVAALTEAITFDETFPTGVVPVVVMTLDDSDADVAVTAPTVSAITNAGFTARFNVTTFSTGTSAENPEPEDPGTLAGSTITPPEDGIELTFAIQLAVIPVLPTINVQIEWDVSAAPKIAWIETAGTIAGTDAAEISSATIDRTTGVMAITFAGGSPPDTDTVRINTAIVPQENATATVFMVRFAEAPMSAAVVTLVWEVSAAGKTATITGTTTIGGTDAADISSVLLDRTTGQLDITFTGGGKPDADTVRLSYTHLDTTTGNWIAVY